MRLAAQGLLLALMLASGCREAGPDQQGQAKPHDPGSPPAPGGAAPGKVQPVGGAGPAHSVSPAATSACHVQGTERVPAEPRRALGTEPFWSATIDGRCVLYATPENQPGTRLWTRYRRTARSETWTGAFEGNPFELVLRPYPGCSDGMSDRSYPFAADLAMGGEHRSGCAMGLGHDPSRP